MKVLPKMLIKIITHYINYLIFLKNKVDIGRNFNVNGVLFVRNLGGIKIGDNFKINSGARFNPIGGDIKSKFYCAKGATLSIGNNVGISNSAIFVTTSVNIEDNVMIGGGCKIWDTDFHSINPVERVYRGDKDIISRPVTIQENAFIGAGALILKGVNIGRNSVVGAGSVVTKSIPKNEIWAGNPARKIRNI